MNLFLAGVVLGLITGHILAIYKHEKLYLSQQERGDYWFARYQQAIRDDPEEKSWT